MKSKLLVIVGRIGVDDAGRKRGEMTRTIIGECEKGGIPYCRIDGSASWDDITEDDAIVVYLGSKAKLAAAIEQCQKRRLTLIIASSGVSAEKNIRKTWSFRSFLRRIWRSSSWLSSTSCLVSARWRSYFIVKLMSRNVTKLRKHLRREQPRRSPVSSAIRRNRWDQCVIMQSREQCSASRRLISKPLAIIISSFPVTGSRYRSTSGRWAVRLILPV